MNCIFCKRDSSASRSREHVVPESLGNTTQVLPAGVVCDSCNNYFAGKVEKPVLESSYFRALRLAEEIPSKRGRYPTVEGLVLPDAPVSLGLDRRWGRYLVLSDEKEAARSALNRLAAPRPTVVFPEKLEMPTSMLFSRFLAKVGLEALALRFFEHAGGIDYIVSEIQFDPVRKHARYGEGGLAWPFSTRRIYRADHVHRSEEGMPEQILFEFDFLYTADLELYFVIAIFGIEFVLNMSGADVTGYQKWLAHEGGRSPLHR